jgi:hypothetical protein
MKDGGSNEAMVEPKLATDLRQDDVNLASDFPESQVSNTSAL